MQKFFRTQAFLGAFTLFFTFLSAGIVSNVDRAKRALVTLLNQLANVIDAFGLGSFEIKLRAKAYLLGFVFFISGFVYNTNLV